MACLGEPGWDHQTVARVFFPRGSPGARPAHRTHALILSQTDRKQEWRAATMKRLFCGLLVSALSFGAVGQARSDLMYWTDYGSGDIRQANLDGTGQTILVRGQRACVGIA